MIVVITSQLLQLSSRKGRFGDQKVDYHYHKVCESAHMNNIAAKAEESDTITTKRDEMTRGKKRKRKQLGGDFPIALFPLKKSERIDKIIWYTRTL